MRPRNSTNLTIINLADRVIGSTNLLRTHRSSSSSFNAYRQQKLVKLNNRAFSNNSSSGSRKDEQNIKESTTITPKTISILKRQAIENAKASYDSLPPFTTGFDEIKLKEPKSFITKPRINLISNLPKIGLKFTKPFKQTDAYGLQFGILPKASSSPPSSSTSDDDRLTHPPTSIDSNSPPSATTTTATTSLIDQALKSRSLDIQKDDSIRLDSSGMETTETIEKTRVWKKEFGSSNDDPTCHKASSPLLVVSHKKLQKLADLINRYRMSLDQAIVQMRFSHKAIASQVLELLLKAKQEAIDRGFKSNRLIVAEAWVTKGFHTSELQVRARGRHGKIEHPTSKICLILRESIDKNKSEFKRRVELKASRRRLNQRGTIPGHPLRLPADGVLPTSVSQRVHWAW